MRIEVTKDWCLRMAELEADEEIGVGLVAVDPVFDGESLAQSEEPTIAFGRFISLMRRNRGLTVEKLADDADVDVAERTPLGEGPVHVRERHARIGGQVGRQRRSQTRAVRLAEVMKLALRR